MKKIKTNRQPNRTPNCWIRQLVHLRRSCSRQPDFSPKFLDPCLSSCRSIRGRMAANEKLSQSSLRENPTPIFPTKTKAMMIPKMATASQKMIETRFFVRIRGALTPPPRIEAPVVKIPLKYGVWERREERLWNEWHTIQRPGLIETGRIRCPDRPTCEGTWTPGTSGYRIANPGHSACRTGPSRSELAPLSTTGPESSSESHLLPFCKVIKWVGRKLKKVEKKWKIIRDQRRMQGRRLIH